MRINTKGIKAFLQDSKAISPAIATLILIVIAAVAAAGIGMIVQNAQKNTEGQVGSQHLDVSGDFAIKGSTTVLPITQAEIAAFEKLYPSVTIHLGGGGSGTGRALVFNKQVDVGASSDIWPDSTSTDTTTGLSYDGRGSAVIQAAGANAFLYETKIGTGMIVLAGYLNDGTNNVKAINIIPGNTSAYDPTNYILNISFVDLKAGYVSGAIDGTKLGTFAKNITTVQRSDDSGTEDTFAAWIGMQDTTSKQLTGSSATGAQGNQGVRDYIAANKNSIGFVDVGFAAGGVNGNAADIAASMNGTVASKTTKGIGANTYDAASRTVTTVSGKGLARDLYYYSQGVPTGAEKAFFDYVLSNDGQTIVEQTGFFRP
jgi:phosphate transport system substrate-binding protein